MSFTIGKRITLTLFGSSHGELVGSVLDGIPAGVKIEPDSVNKWLDRRKPAANELTTQRKEEDHVEIVSGTIDGVSDGGSITMLIRNKDAISSHYDDIRNLPRPGHGDLTLFQKYGEYRNYAGGGFLSGRMTAPIVAAGSVCIGILERAGISIVAWLDAIGPISTDKEPEDPDSVYSYRTRICDPEADTKAQKLLRELISSGDSIGARIRVKINSLPAGIGEPFFDSLESSIAHGMFSIPAVKGIEFGSGFRLSEMKGSEAMDSIYFDGSIKTRNNHNGGILGGISNGMPVLFDVAIKPTSSIRKPLETVDLRTMEAGKLMIKGRHDPCIGIRAVPVVQCLTAFILLDQIMQSGNPDLIADLLSGKHHTPRYEKESEK